MLIPSNGRLNYVQHLGKIIWIRRIYSQLFTVNLHGPLIPAQWAGIIISKRSDQQCQCFLFWSPGQRDKIIYAVTILRWHHCVYTIIGPVLGARGTLGISKLTHNLCLPHHLITIGNRFNYKENNVTKNRCAISDINIMLGPHEFGLQAAIGHQFAKNRSRNKHRNPWVGRLSLWSRNSIYVNIHTSTYCIISYTLVSLLLLFHCWYHIAIYVVGFIVVIVIDNIIITLWRNL